MSLPSALKIFCRKKKLVAFFGIPLFMTLHFLLLPLVLTLTFNLCHFNYNMSCYGAIWVHLVWDYRCFLYQDIIFLQLWENFSHNFIKNIFHSLSCSLLWGSYNVNFGMLCVMQLALYVCSHFFVTLFFILLSWLVDFHYSIFQITCMFFCVLSPVIHSFLCVFYFSY